MSRVLRRAGLSKLASLQPAEPVQRYEHAAAGELLHIDTKKLGRIVRTGHRITGDRRDHVRGIGWEYLFVAIDDHARIGFTQMHPDERQASAVAFLHDAVAYYGRLGVTIKRLLTDNGAAFRSRAFRAACTQLGIRHKFTRAYRPQTNGKAERFIQSALREWAYGIAYDHSSERTAMLAKWQHYYNCHRPHAGIGNVPPMSRLKPASRNNVLTLHNSGLNYWSFVPTVAYTGLWPEHGVEFSTLGSVQFNTRNKDTDYQSAPLLTLEALVAKDLGSGWRAGPVAAWVQQLADDKGPLADRLSGFRGYSVALGPMVAYPMKLGEARRLDAMLRWTPSSASSNLMEGNAFTLTASVAF